MLRIEWRRLWVRPFAWIMAAVVIAVMAWELVLMLGPFLARQAQLTASGANIGYTDLVLLPWLALFVVALLLMAPLLTMTMLAGERRGGTLGLWFAGGLSPVRIVLGKYLAALGWLLLVLLALVAMILVVSLAGSPDWGKLAAALLGLVLLAALLTAIGLACSAFASHPALAAASALVISLLLMLVDHASLHAGVLADAAHWLALPTHLQPMGRGLVSSADVAWFIILTVLALTLAIHRVGQEKDRD